MKYLQLPTASPSQQRTNKENWNLAREQGEADFFTIGYVKRSQAEFLIALDRVQVSTVVDVRHIAASRYRPEFSKKNLRLALAGRDIDYLHLPELGVPRDVRAMAIDSGTRDSIWTWYDESVARIFAGTSLRAFFDFADHPTAFMCVEMDPTSCHRHRLALALERAGLRGFDL